MAAFRLCYAQGEKSGIDIKTEGGKCLVERGEVNENVAWGAM